MAENKLEAMAVDIRVILELIRELGETWPPSRQRQLALPILGADPFQCRLGFIKAHRANRNPFRLTDAILALHAKLGVVAIIPTPQPPDYALAGIVNWKEPRRMFLCVLSVPGCLITLHRVSVAQNRSTVNFQSDSIIATH